MHSSGVFAVFGKYRLRPSMHDSCAAAERHTAPKEYRLLLKPTKARGSADEPSAAVATGRDRRQMRSVSKRPTNPGHVCAKVS